MTIDIDLKSTDLANEMDTEGCIPVSYTHLRAHET